MHNDAGKGQSRGETYVVVNYVKGVEVVNITITAAAAIKCY